MTITWVCVNWGICLHALVVDLGLGEFLDLGLEIVEEGYGIVLWIKGWFDGFFFFFFFF